MQDKEVNHEELKEIIGAAYKCKRPLFIRGTFGIGKSTAVRDYCKKTEIEFIDVRISQLEPSDLRGLPNFDNEKKVTRWFAPSWLPKDGNGILFLDEINLAPPSIQAAAYQLILDREIGEYKLPDGWVVVAAGNRDVDRAHVFEMAKPLLNRFLHTELKVPTIDEWTDWAIENEIDSRIVMFLQKWKSLLFKFDKDSKDDSIPTPRTWEYCSDLINGVDDLKKLRRLVGTAVGEATALQFSKFLSLQRHIDVDGILKDPKKVKELADMDLKYCFVTAVVEQFKGMNKGKKKVEFLKQIFRVADYFQPEFAVYMLRFTKKFDGKEGEMFMREFVKFKGTDGWAKKYTKYFN